MVEVAKGKKTLSVMDKVNVITQIESGKEKADVCWDSVNSTTQIIWKKGDKTVSTLGEEVITI